MKENEDDIIMCNHMAEASRTAGVFFAGMCFGLFLSFIFIFIEKAAVYGWWVVYLAFVLSLVCLYLASRSFHLAAIYEKKILGIRIAKIFNGSGKERGKI